MLLLLATGGIPLDKRQLVKAAGRAMDDVTPMLAILEQRGLIQRHGELFA